ncbi:GNAT family N-acetyltransferase [Deinococcus ruber]|uniref:N-acetyltransferase domain-containing protein n=1 Tax=Deinococcus ruber TaxID=1848197 RepID=A0A918BXP7_9DEIO|nr:GNAT family N-acetyltransferase [Deinococcus ruber]GGQ95474.1 hypothetical protein GCM10008957_04900 [Deinococcus ruber]
MIVRQAIEADVGAIARICSESWRVTYKNIMSSRAIEQGIRRRFKRKTIYQQVCSPVEWKGWLIAEAEGKVVGVGLRSRISNFHVTIEELNIDSTFFRQGIGRSLIEEMTRLARVHEAILQSVSVIGGSSTAISFYESLGFEFAYASHGIHKITREPTFVVRLRRYLESESERRLILERWHGQNR